MTPCDAYTKRYESLKAPELDNLEHNPKVACIKRVNLPSIVMSGICPDCLSEARHCAVQLFRQHVLMTKQRVGISEGLTNLDSSLEEFDCCIVFLLQTEAVTSCAPSLQNTHVCM